MYVPLVSEALQSWQTRNRLADVRQREADARFRMAEQQVRALESTLELFDRYIDPSDEFFDDTGREIWSRFGLKDATAVASVYTTEQKLTEVRDYGRWLWGHNPFARCGHENRINYTVGQGHNYRVQATANEEPSEDLIDQVRNWFDDWQKANRWGRRQRETIERYDRDGEVFRRWFPGLDGILRVRFVEPEHVKSPPEVAGDESVRYGIRFDPDDAETVLAYYVGGESIEAGEIQHRKANVDLAAPRGVPLFYPVRANLRRAVGLLKTITILATSRSNTPWIEKHVGATQAQVQAYLSGKKDIQVTSSKGDTVDYERTRPGTVKHVRPNTEFEYPPAPEIVQQVAGIQAELRAVASRTCMPEFMLTSDASNANYSSTMVAEGPAVKMFERLQGDMIDDDAEIIRLALEHAVASGVVPQQALDQVEIVAEAPNVQTRDRLKEAQADQVLRNQRVMSKATLAARHGLVWKDEQENMEDENEAETGFAVPPVPFGGRPGDQQGKGQEQGDEEDES